MTALQVLGSWPRICRSALEQRRRFRRGRSREDRGDLREAL